MPLEHILRAMQAQADREIDQVTSAADEEAQQLLAEAQAEAQQIHARHCSRVEPMLATQAASLQNRSKLGALRATANAREELLVAAFKQAEDCLAEMRTSPRYAEIFHALACEAVEGLGAGPASGTGESLVANVDARDVELAEKTFAALGANVEIQVKPIPLGGLEVMTRDGRIVNVNTLASRLDHARTLLRGPVASILAG